MPPIYTELEDAILRTLLYANVFHFPLTQAEIHRYLIGCSADEAGIARTLASSTRLQRFIMYTDGYYALCNDEEIIGKRQAKQDYLARLHRRAKRYGQLIAALPFVRMVAVTGALAVDNPRGPADDLDYLIVTRAGRVWLTRALVILLVRLARLRGVRLCPNYVLAEDALEQERQDLYTAHELIQMRPVYGFGVYTEMRRVNRWSDLHLPNTAIDVNERSQPETRRILKQFGEWLLGSRLGDKLESWEQHRKLRKFERAAQTPGASFKLDAQHVKGHFNDYGGPALSKYRAFLLEYGFAEERTP